MKSVHRRVTVGVVAASLTLGLGAFGVANAASAPLAAASASQVRLIVGLKPGVDAKANLSSLTALGLSHAGTQRAGVASDLLAEVGAKALQVPKSRQASTVAALQRDPDVAYVQVDPQAKSFAAPNDPVFVNNRQPELKHIKIPTAWNTTTGGRIKVAVIDTGVSPVGDLSGRVLPGYDFVNQDTNAADDGYFPHGTVVASLIAATPNNGVGMAGVCAKCDILPVKVLDPNGDGWYTDIAEGIIYAAQQGAKVINLSLGGSSSSPVLQDAVAYAVGRGSLVVAAAGNAGNQVKQYPAAYGDVLAVGATNTRSANGQARASFSSYGSWVDVAAPGITAGMRNNGYYCWDGDRRRCWDSYYDDYEVQGTSFAAPLVAGVAALVATKNPKYNGWSLLNAIRASARYNGWTEKGLVDANAALTKGTDTTAPVATGISPAQNAKVRSTVTITPTGLKDNWSGIGKIDLYVDGKWHSWDYTYPWGPKLYTRSRNGAVKVQMKITDKAGNSRWTGTRTLVADNVLPSASITKAPKNKARVKGTVSVSVKAGDKSGISKVQLLVNGKVAATDTTAGYKLSFKVAKQKKTMKVRVRVYDKAGNVRYLTTRTYYRA